VAEARWESLVAARPEMSAPVTLQRHLISAVLDLTDALESGGVRRLSLPAGYLTAKTRGGIPALAGEPIPLPVDQIAPTIRTLCEILEEHGGGEAAVRLAAAAKENRLEMAALTLLTLRREQAAIRTAATKAGLGHDLLWLVADMAVGPFAHVMRATLFDACAAGSPLRAALDAWSWGHCPLCGTWPSCAEMIDGRRVLRCAFCAAAWVRVSESCGYCGKSGDEVTVMTPDAGEPTRGVQSCRACRGYLKLVGTTESLPFPLLPIGDLASMDLDMLAIQHGFARPAIRSFAPRR
jgi:FdhE protein